MHVAIIGHTAALSGGELALARMLPYLQTDHLDVTVVLAEDGPLVPVVRGIGARVVVIPLSAAVRNRSRADTATLGQMLAGVPSTLSYVRRLRSWLLDNDVQLVHTNTLKAAVYAGIAGRTAGLPVLWHIRDRIARDYLPSSTTTLIHVLSLVIPQRIAVNSATTAASLPRLARKRVQIVPDCVDRPDTGSARSEHRPGADRSTREGMCAVVGMMGRLAPWKGQHIALEAFWCAFAGDPGVQLAFVGSAMFGEDDYEQGLRARVGELGLADRVEFRGFRGDIWKEYATFDVAVHASVIPEPFGQVVIESMAARVPVIASAAGGPAEVVRHGVNGLLVPPGDIASLAQAMAGLVHQPAVRRRLADRGAETAQAYSPRATVLALRGLYGALARSSHRVTS